MYLLITCAVTRGHLTGCHQVFKKEILISLIVIPDFKKGLGEAGSVTLNSVVATSNT